MRDWHPTRAVVLAWTILALLGAPGWSAADSAFPGTVLSPEGERALQKGLIAAEQRLWPQAVAAFAKARKEAPANPDTLYNLGLANLARGNALAGAAWLKAYLAATPQAPNRAAVEKEIARQQLAWQVRIDAIIDKAVAAAELLPDQYKRGEALRDVSYDVGPAGYEGDVKPIGFGATTYGGLCVTAVRRLDFAPCPDLIASIPEEGGWKSAATRDYAIELVKTGQTKEAEKLLPSMTAEHADAWYVAVLDYALNGKGTAWSRLTPEQVHAAEPYLARIPDGKARTLKRLGIVERIGPYREEDLSAADQAEIALQLGRVMDALPDPGRETMEKVAAQLRRIGRADEARAWLQKHGARLLQAALKEDNPYLEPFNLYLDMERPDKALDWLEKQVLPKMEKSNALDIFGNARRPEDRERERKQNIKYTASYYARVVQSWFRRGDPREAVRQIERTPAPYRNNEEFADAYGAWAQWLIGEKHDLKQAVDVLNRTYDNPFNPGSKATVIAPAVAEAVRRGDMDTAAWASTALKPMPFSSDKPLTEKEAENRRAFNEGRLFWRVTNTLIAKGEPDSALAYLEAVKARMHLFLDYLIPLEEALVKAGRGDEALALIRRDFGPADYFSGNQDYVRRLAELAGVTVEAGRKDLAEQVLLRAEEVLAGAGDEASVVYSWDAAGAAWLAVGRKDRALAWADRAAKEIMAKGDHEGALKLAGRYQACGATARAETTLAMAGALRWIALAGELEGKKAIQDIDAKISALADEMETGKVPGKLSDIARDMGEALTGFIRLEREK